MRDDRLFHVMTIDEVVASLATDPEGGLGTDEVVARRAASGPNELLPAKRTPPWRLFLSQYNDFMIWVLLAAVAVSAIEGQVPEAVAILAILLLNGVLGFAQEYRAERALEALKEMSAPAATVVRGGRELDVPAAELVPGDVLLLEAGDRIPADARLTRVAVLRVDESSLTGESLPASKSVGPVADPEAALGDRDNTVFAGTSVAVGRGRAVVTAIGQATEMGRIAELLASQEETRTPLQEELKRVGKQIALLVLGICAMVFAVEVWRSLADSGLGLLDALNSPAARLSISTALLVAISLAVAAIPEGLPAIVTVALSLGVRKMAARNAIVRRLHAVETLGSTSFICSDKTGTLTRNEMTVRRLLVGLDGAEVSADFALVPDDAEPTHEDRELLLMIAASCNDARFGDDERLIGDPTETALIVAERRLASDPIRPHRIGEVPFDSQRKRMTTVHEYDGRRTAFMKGGADVVLGLCAHALLRGETAPMTEELRERLQGENARLASTGHRTLAFAFRTLDADEPSEGEALERDMTYVGIMGLLDPPRREAAAAIVECHRAGIQVAMVTGDHALTARAAGAEIGLLEGNRVVTGAEIASMSDDDLYEAAADVRIYARVDPEHKLRIVDALKRRGHIVAMTGDGVNDAPALKRADIGVAMGLVGTDVSREAADMVLADDNFATIVEAVRQGRVVFDNLRKFILFLLSCNISEVAIVFTTALLSPTPALLPLQLLWINLVTDGLPALALGVDPGSPRVMERSPRTSGESILTKRTRAQVIAQGLLITLGALAMYLGVASGLVAVDGPAHAQTMLFTTIVLSQLLHAFNFRSQTRTVFSLDSLKNHWLVAAFIGSMALQVAVIYTPALQAIFRTQPLGIHDWLAVGIASMLPLVVIDTFKVIGARRTLSGTALHRSSVRR
ncbi:MAG TPA: calcium-translocating P-type ATPase, PMCA-type [Coriobacteriia bacterium]